MKTKPIDYTGCNPEIAECLKRGEARLCRVWGMGTYTKNTGYITNYTAGHRMPYKIEAVGVLAHEVAEYAEPVKTVTRVKKASEIVKWLEDNGYKPDRSGNWMKLDGLAFANILFQYCEKEAPIEYPWLLEWLEEVEE